MNLALLECLGRAVVKNAPVALLRCLPFGEALYDIAKDALGEWKRRRQAAVDRRAELEALAQAGPAEVRQQAQAVAAAVAPPEMQTALSDYLERLPGVVRRSLSRPEDPSGRTAPAALPLDKPEDLVPFLPPRPPRFRPGDRPDGIGGWALQELLGVGGFGEVWLAHNSAGRQAALKFCLDPMSANSLRNEKELLHRVQDQNEGKTGLVRLLQSYLDVDPPCLVFDYIPGGDLTRLIRCWHESHPTPARLHWETVRLVYRLAGILSGAHQLVPAVVHRDLKPSNILLQPTAPNRVRLCVADFGIGGIAAQRAVASSFATSAKEVLTTSLRGAHTPLYASPQQKEGHPASPRDDVYALGVIGYQVLTGDTTVAPPADMDEELSERQVPDRVSRLLGQCLIEEAEDRLANAAVLTQALGELLAQLPRPKRAWQPA